MPCSDSRDYDNTALLNAKINTLKKEFIELDAALCSIVNFLNSKGLISEACDYAKTNSKFNLSRWVEQHKREDKKRLSDILKKQLSKDEISLIIQMAKDGDLKT